MSYRIVVEFPDKQTADRWCGQMSDGIGENFSDFINARMRPGTDGTKNWHWERVTDRGRPVYFVTWIGDEYP